MFDLLSIEFERPGWLILILLVLPAYLMARRSIGGLSPLKTHITFGLRAVVITLLAMALARPSWQQRGEGLSVVLLVDRSRSIPLELQVATEEYLRAAVEVERDKQDRLGVITFADNATITQLPEKSGQVELSGELGDLAGTNIADAVRLALAVLPKDTANRIVLVSDGNETEDSAMAAAEAAKANNIPIDILELRYTHDREVIFDRLVAPARAREGQVSNLKMLLRSQSVATGTLTLLQNGQPVDLDPESDGNSVRVELQPGLNTQSVPMLFDSPGPQQFEAIFEPDDVNSDFIKDNNSAVAVTFVSGEGKILLIDDSLTESEALASALRDSDLTVDILPPSAIDSMVTLAGYDAVVLMNQPRWSFSESQDTWLHAYVHDLGGGLVMIGGDRSFGAGGWIDQQLAKALPVDLDPPQTIQRQRGALGLIMHSCEIPQGNFWGEKVAISAIEALSSQDYVGIVDFDWAAGGSVWEFDKSIGGLALAGDKSAPIAAAKSMPVGDMPDFEGAMVLMLNGMININANKHVIIISDGDPSPPTQGTLQGYLDNRITVTTVLIGSHGMTATMKAIANFTGGNFYDIKDPRALPQIFIEEARIVARSLIVEEGTIYNPEKRAPLSEPTRGYNGLPGLRGYVLTAPKEGVAEIAFVSDAHNDPIYAHWNYGLGKSIAFTGDLTGRWGGEWVSWTGFKGFWDQSMRWVMRPASPPNMIVNTRTEGDTAIVELEAVDTNASFLNFLGIGAVVIGPDGEADPLSLQQVGPGRYRGQFRTNEAGAYLINMNLSKGEERLGNLQAAVNVPYAREFRDVSDNSARMRAIQSATGGRVLDPRTPGLANLFDRTGLTVPKSKLSIWDLLAILAATLFLLDVAARRLSIGVDDVRRTLAKAMGKRTDSAADTVAAWKKARASVKHRRDDEQPVEIDRTVKFEADEASKGKSFSVGSDTAESPRDARPTGPKRRDEEKKPEADEGDYTSRLLAAKRRAAQQRGKQDGDQGSGGGA